jgi:hypothetical protein
LIIDLNQKLGPGIYITAVDRVLTVLIKESFIVIIKFSSEFQYNFKITVTNVEEFTTYIQQTRRERKFANILKRTKVDEKSSYKLMRKIGMLLEDRLNFLLKFGKYPPKVGLTLFLVTIDI